MSWSNSVKSDTILSLVGATVAEEDEVLDIEEDEVEEITVELEVELGVVELVFSLPQPASTNKAATWDNTNNFLFI